MASSFALRNELRAVVLRGLKRLRDIEIVHQLAEEMVLDARMVVAASLDEQFDDEWAPSPEEIVASCVAIQDTWSDEERERRGRFEYTSTRLKRHIADFKDQRQRPFTAESIRVDASLGYDTSTVNSDGERRRRWREQNRDRIRAQRQDPAYKEKKREQDRRYRERSKFLMKEWEYANREKRNAACKSRYYENLEVRRERARLRAAANREEINVRRREVYAQRKGAELAAAAS